MPEVRRASEKTKAGAELYVAKAVPHTSEEHLKAEDRLCLKRVKVRARDEGDECTAFGPKNLIRSGRPMGIKPNLHWVIKSLPDGDMEIMPVKGWYDLATTGSSHDPRRSARPGVTGHATPQRDAAVMELQQQAMVRKESADRWDAISKRRMQRIEESGGARRAFPLAEDLDAAKASEEKRRKVQIMYPEDPDAADDTGFKHQEEKRRKVLQKLQKAQDAGTEEQAVPDVASTLLDLKRQGEGAWDFSDEEEFSDDEEKVAPEANPKEVEGLPEEDANLPSGDEEDEETKPEATLSGVGEELKVLLKVDPETAESPPRFEEPMEAGSPDQDMSPISALSTERSPSVDHAELKRRAVTCLKEKGELSPKELLQILRTPKESFKFLKEVLSYDKSKGVVQLKP